jgi:hypothetical protein
MLDVVIFFIIIVIRNVLFLDVLLDVLNVYKFQFFLTPVRTQREMALSSPYGRCLIVVHGEGELDMFSLDRTFGGTENRAEVTLSQLRDTIKELLVGKEFEGTIMKVVNGLRDGYFLFMTWLISEMGSSFTIPW